ncbi:WD40 repeat-like protein [Xylariaceae sp. AK1471]|nr:WD40 repeat-like protein [Xylariaceae sp. AK1471]
MSESDNEALVAQQQQRATTKLPRLAFEIWKGIPGYFINTLKGHTNTDVATGEVKKKFTGANKMHQSAFSSDGSLVAKTERDSQNEVTKLIGHTESIYGIAISRGGKYIEASTGNQGVSFHPTLDLLASVSHDSTVKIWEYHFGGLITTLTGHTSWVQPAVFSPDGNILASGGEDKTIRLWDVRDMQNVKVLKTLTGHTNMLASGSDDGTLRLWGVHTGFLIRTFTFGTPIYSVVFSKDQELIACSIKDGRVVMIEAGPDLKTLKSLTKYAKQWDEVDGTEFKLF